MLENTIIIIVSIWLILIPMCFEIVSLVKGNGIPRFFRVKPSTRYIVLGMLMFLLIFRIDITDYTVGITDDIRYYSFICMLITIVWEIIKYKTVNKHSQAIKDFESVKVCMLIDDYIMDYLGYNLFIAQSSEANKTINLSKGVWVLLKDSVDVKNIDTDVLANHLATCRNHAIKLKDSSILLRTIKLELKYLNTDNDVIVFYKKCLQNPSNNDEKCIKEMIESKNNLLNLIKEK